MYKINDYLVYGKDVCKVYEINEKRFNNTDYYLLRPIKDSSLKIEAPVTSNKIRPVITKERLDEIIEEIPKIKPIETNDKFIETEYKRLLSESTHEDLIKIIKTTYLRNKERLDNNKKVAEKDKNYFELAEEYLYNEFSIVLGYTFNETKEYVIQEVLKSEKEAN